MKTETRSAEVIEFNNRPPMRTTQEIRVIWLGYAHLDFGGRRFKYCPALKGGWHAWYRFTSPYSDGTSYNAYLGVFTDYASLAKVVGTHEASEYGGPDSIMSQQEQSTVLAELPQLLGFEAPLE